MNEWIELSYYSRPCEHHMRIPQTFQVSPVDFHIPAPVSLSPRANFPEPALWKATLPLQEVGWKCWGTDNLTPPKAASKQWLTSGSINTPAPMSFGWEDSPAGLSLLMTLYWLLPSLVSYPHDLLVFLSPPKKLPTPGSLIVHSLFLGAANPRQLRGLADYTWANIFWAPPRAIPNRRCQFLAVSLRSE